MLTRRPARLSALGAAALLALSAPAEAATSLTRYGYDALGRLTTVTSPLATTTYTYDPAGNRTAVTAARTAYRIIVVPTGGMKLIYQR